MQHQLVDLLVFSYLHELCSFMTTNKYFKAICAIWLVFGRYIFCCSVYMLKLLKMVKIPSVVLLLNSYCHSYFDDAIIVVHNFICKKKQPNKKNVCIPNCFTAIAQRTFKINAKNFTFDIIKFDFQRPLTFSLNKAQQSEISLRSLTLFAIYKLQLSAWDKQMKSKQVEIIWLKVN